MARVIDRSGDGSNWSGDHGGIKPAVLSRPSSQFGRPRDVTIFPKAFSTEEPYDVLCDAKEVAFITEYLKDWNGRQAAIRAGIVEAAPSGEVSSAAALGTARDYLNREHVRVELLRRVKEKHYDPEITPERVVTEIAVIALSNIWDYCEVVTNEFGGQELRLLESFKTSTGDIKPKILGSAVKAIKQNRRGEISIQLHEKQWALGVLTKWMGMASEKSPLEVLMELLPEYLQGQLREAISNRLATSGASTEVDNLIMSRPNSLVQSVEDVLESENDFDPCI